MLSCQGVNLPYIFNAEGRVILKDYPTGPQFLSWWKQNKDWAGQPLWADKSFREHASCAGFEVQIICWNSDPEVKGSVWEMGPTLLGTQAMIRAGLQPYPSAQPAEIIQNLRLKLSADGVDTWYRFGRIQSVPIPSGDGMMVQYYELIRLEWPSDASPSEIGKVGVYCVMQAPFSEFPSSFQIKPIAWVGLGFSAWSTFAFVLLTERTSAKARAQEEMLLEETLNHPWWEQNAA